MHRPFSPKRLQSSDPCGFCSGGTQRHPQPSRLLRRLFQRFWPLMRSDRSSVWRPEWRRSGWHPQVLIVGRRRCFSILKLLVGGWGISAGHARNRGRRLGCCRCAHRDRPRKKFSGVEATENRQSLIPVEFSPQRRIKSGWMCWTAATSLLTSFSLTLIVGGSTCFIWIRHRRISCVLFQRRIDNNRRRRLRRFDQVQLVVHTSILQDAFGRRNVETDESVSDKSLRAVWAHQPVRIRGSDRRIAADNGRLFNGRSGHNKRFPGLEQRTEGITCRWSAAVRRN